MPPPADRDGAVKVTVAGWVTLIATPLLLVNDREPFTTVSIRQEAR